VELWRQLLQDFVHHRADRSQRMVTAHSLLWGDVAEHVTLLLIVSSHASSTRSALLRYTIPEFFSSLLVAKMVASKLGPKSINNYVQVVKMTLASAVNDDGEQLYPRKWNHEYIDLPMVDKSKQNAPSISSEIMTSWRCGTRIENGYCSFFVPQPG
jgi:hypothetical protein